MAGLRTFDVTGEAQRARGFTVSEERHLEEAAQEYVRGRDAGDIRDPITTWATVWSVAQKDEFRHAVSTVALALHQMVQKLRPDLVRTRERHERPAATRVPVPPAHPAVSDYQRQLQETIDRSIRMILQRPDADKTLHALAAKAYELAGPPPPP